MRNRITRNNDFIEYFVNGGREQKSCNNLHIKEDKLFNYNTVIAELKEDGMYINMSKYSKSTSRIQNVLLEEAEYRYRCSKKVVILTGIEKNSQSL